MNGHGSLRRINTSCYNSSILKLTQHPESKRANCQFFFDIRKTILQQVCNGIAIKLQHMAGDTEPLMGYAQAGSAAPHQPLAEIEPFKLKPQENAFLVGVLYQDFSQALKRIIVGNKPLQMLVISST